MSAPDYDLALWSWPGDSQQLRGFIGYLVADPNTDGWANLSGTVDADLDALSTQLLTTAGAEQREMLNEQIQDQFSTGDADDPPDLTQRQLCLPTRRL